MQATPFRFLHVSVLSAVILIQVGLADEDSPLRSFSTHGHTVYHLRLGRMEPAGRRVLVAAATDGTVLCLDQDGKSIWKNQVSEALPLDLAVGDIDGDGCDETLLASADGVL